jgi:alkylation response protein AidB-like acyl-CoA dehydrogenase
VETVRHFAASELRPLARECYETRTLPDAAIGRAHALGLVANALPEEHGGGGARSAVTAALVIEELAWGDLALALAILSPALVALPVADFGSPAQRRAWLPAFAGERFVPASLAVVEPSFRSDALAPQTRARREGAGFALSGRVSSLQPGGDGARQRGDRRRPRAPRRASMACRDARAQPRSARSRRSSNRDVPSRRGTLGAGAA